MLLDLKSIHFTRGDKVILNDVNWKMPRGTHWAVLGKNGSGKTSLLRIATGYEWATTGTVRVLGNQFGRVDIREVRKHIGWVTQSLFRDLPGAVPVREHVLSGKFSSYGLWDKVNPRDERRALELMRQQGLENLAEKPFSLLSQGEKQRTLLARALMADSKLLIFDEPCTGLDPSAREIFLTRLETLARSSDAAGQILVTHHIEEITPHFTHALILKDGKVLASGRTDDVLTAEILAEAFDLNAQVERHNQRFWLKVG